MLIERYMIIRAQMQLAQQRDVDADLTHYESELTWMRNAMTPEDRAEVDRRSGNAQDQLPLAA